MLATKAFAEEWGESGKNFYEKVDRLDGFEKGFEHLGRYLEDKNPAQDGHSVRNKLKEIQAITKLDLDDDTTAWVKVKDGVSYINIPKVSKGQASDHENRAVYWSVGGTTTAFFYKGIYEGDFFEREYVWRKDQPKVTKNSSGEERSRLRDYLDKYPKGGPVLMRIGPNMNQNDGVIEGFAVERLSDGRREILIFLDEDWKTKLPNTNIVTGRSSEYEAPFSFKSIGGGIFMDAIEDDPKRLSRDYMERYWGIGVGNITSEKARKGDMKDVKSLLFQ